MIKHVSLDAWNTLLIPNPTFAKLRNEYLASLCGISDHQMKIIYDKTKRFVDDSAEHSCKAFTTPQVYDLLFTNYVQMSSKFARNTHSFDIEYVMNHINVLFIENPPTIPNNTIKTLNCLKHYDIEWGIISNTNFISGEVLHKVIMSEFPEYSDQRIFALYSDLVRMAKPALGIFDKLYQYKKERFECIQKKHIVHIGDNITCDVIGAAQYGFTTALVNHPSELSDVIENICFE
jgi:FMN phosphatase YigB (HAD superfamily)